MAFFPPDSVVLVTHAVLKTIAALANTEGGTLLIGVDDDGDAVGIDADQFQNDDKFVLHLMTAVKTTMGGDVGALVQPEVNVFQGKRVCVVRCRRSHEPVYLKVKGGDERRSTSARGHQRLSSLPESWSAT